MTHTWLFDLRDRDRLRVSGADTPAFLQRLLTLAIDRVPVGGGSPAFLLTSTGKIQAAFDLLRVGDDDFWLDCAPGAGEGVAAALDFYLFGERVAIEPLAGWTQVSVQGPAAADVLRAAGLPVPAEAPGSHVAFAGGRVVRVDRTGSGGFDVWAPEPPRLAAEPAGPELLEALRVEAGLPAWGHEYTDQVIPLEVSGMAGITDHKGCYPGQEVVERIISLGRPPRALIGLTLTGDANVGDAVGDAGAITSVAALPDGTRVALALVKRRAAEEAQFVVNGAPATRRPLGGG